MKVTRKQEMETNNIQIGDQIQLGKYTATCQKVTDVNSFFLLFQYFDKLYAMNATNTNKGGYGASDLRAEFKNIILDPNFDSIRSFLVPFKNGDFMRLPTVGEMFGHNDYYEMDDAQQWELMKDRRNRIALREGDEYEWGWLQNDVKESAAYFAFVYWDGHSDYLGAALSAGVRPALQLVL